MKLTIDVFKDRFVKFKYYRDKELWYDLDGFLFPVSIEDAGTATFKDEDKAIFFMRWIRKHRDEINEEQNA